MSSLKNKRNLEILSRYAAGQTLLEVAKFAGVTRQRVEQILREKGVDKKSGGISLKLQTRRETLLKEIEPALLVGASRAEFIKKGISINDLNAAVNSRPELHQRWKSASEVARYGISRENLISISAIYGKSWQEMMALYQSSRKNAHNRDCTWSLTLQDWLTLWIDSGAWAADNFNKEPRYGLVRVNSEDLNYRVGNVQILTQSQISEKTQRRVWSARKLNSA